MSGDEEAAYLLGLRFLEQKGRSRTWVCARLRSEGFSEEIAEAAADRLTAEGFVREELDIMLSLATALSESKGREGLQRRLLEQGYDSEQVADALAVLTDETELVRAVHWLRRKFRCKTGETPMRARARALAQLVRRGFDEEIAQSAVEEVFGSEP